jgi:(4S)-4-hydroxy-5-phosphonooxypentane-2,3-dione isomerase
MYAVLVKLRIKPENKENYMRELLLDAEGATQKEPGCLQFNIIAHESEPNSIMLFELYKSEADYQNHRTMPHYLKWREAVKDFYTSPPEINRGNIEFPPANQWKVPSN